MFKAPPPEVSTEEFYETDPSKPYKRGFSIQTVSPLPITWAEHVMAQGHWGADLRDYMSDYVHWACLGALCEFLPQAGQPGDARGREGPARPARRALLLHPVRQRPAAGEGGRRDVMERILRGGRRRGGHDDRPLRAPGRRRPHGRATSGTASSTATAAPSPCRTCFITDGSVLPTQGSANPALTIMAIAARVADRLLTDADRLLGRAAHTGAPA